MRRCVQPACTKYAVGRTDRCVEHGGGRRCAEPACGKSAVGRTDRCVEHGGGRRCAEPACSKSAVGRTDKCVEHGGGQRCPLCVTWVDARCGSRQYDGHCARCFKRAFPADPRSARIYERTREARVRNAIVARAATDADFAGFVHDRPITTGHCDCTHRRRVDHHRLIGNTILAVETDEKAHRGYSARDEELRYHDLYMVHSGKWVYIRFNPDRTRTQKSGLEQRVAALLQTIKEQVARIELEQNEELLEVIRLFY